MANITVKCLVGGMATAAVMGYAHLGQSLTENIPLPSEESNMQFECCLPDEYYQDSHYSIINQSSEVCEQIETIHGFVSSLLENTQDLDPRISKLVDDNFWELG